MHSFINGLLLHVFRYISNRNGYLNTNMYFLKSLPNIATTGLQGLIGPSFLLI